MWKKGDILKDHGGGTNGYLLVVKFQFNDNNMRCTVLNNTITGYKTGGFSTGMNPEVDIWKKLGKCLINSHINNIDKSWNDYD